MYACVCTRHIRESQTRCKTDFLLRQAIRRHYATTLSVPFTMLQTESRWSGPFSSSALKLRTICVKRMIRAQTIYHVSPQICINYYVIYCGVSRNLWYKRGQGDIMANCKMKMKRNKIIFKLLWEKNIGK